MEPASPSPAPPPTQEDDSIQVVCRVRPQNSREATGRCRDAVTVSGSDSVVVSALGKQFSFDTVLGPDSSQVCVRCASGAAMDPWGGSGGRHHALPVVGIPPPVVSLHEDPSVSLSPFCGPLQESVFLTVGKPVSEACIAGCVSSPLRS